MSALNTGEKIKKLRTDKSMTQAELAGNKITRNMLSLIESGAAVPSLGTVKYLAERLNVPAGILVSDDNDEFFYRKLIGMENIKKALVSGNYRICRELCDSLDPDGNDDEIAMIRAVCSLGIAKEAFADGHLRAACAEFDEASSGVRKTVYNVRYISAEAEVYCRYMRSVSPTLYSESADGETAEALAFGDPFCVYATVLRYISSGDADGAGRLLPFLGKGFYREHIGAKLGMMRGDFAGALAELRVLLNDGEKVGTPVIYDIFRDLEVCCREAGDFKGAYEYSGAKVVMLERLLSEVD